MTAGPASRNVHRYMLFGLCLESEIPLPEMQGQLPADPRRAVDFAVRLGTPAHDEDGFTLDVPNVARFTIAGGRSITVTPAPNAGEREIRLFLLGSAMGIALHQRGVLPLHANAVEVNGLAIAFMGRSGSGKSTLAAWFHDQGFRILADDVCVIRMEKDGPHAHPGLPRLRLWQDALEASGRIAGHHDLSFHLEDDSRRKFDVAVAPCGLAQSDLPLRAIFLLQDGEEMAIDRLGGASAVDALAANTYRGRYIAEVGDSSAHLQTCVEIAGRVPIFRLRRPLDRNRFEAHCRSILNFVAQV